MREENLFLIHPETKQAFTVEETAALLGMTTGAVYGRLRLGDVGARLWRPKGTKMKKNEPGNTADLAIIKCHENEKIIL